MADLLFNEGWLPVCVPCLCRCSAALKASVHVPKQSCLPAASLSCLPADTNLRAACILFVRQRRRPRGRSRPARQAPHAVPLAYCLLLRAAWCRVMALMLATPACTKLPGASRRGMGHLQPSRGGLVLQHRL